MNSKEKEAQSGKLSKDDLRHIINTPKELRKISLLAFNCIDLDRSGTISENELHSLMADLARRIGCPAPSMPEVEGAMRAMDHNNDGLISVDEFTVLIKELILMIIDL